MSNVMDQKWHTLRETLIEAGTKKPSNYLALKEKHLWGRGAVEEKAVSEFVLVERGAGQGRRERERRGEERRGPHWKMWVAKKVTMHACMVLISDCLRLSADGVDVRGVMLRSLCLFSKCFLCESAPISASAGLCPHHDQPPRQHAEAECHCEMCLFSN